MSNSYQLTKKVFLARLTAGFFVSVLGCLFFVLLFSIALVPLFGLFQFYNSVFVFWISFLILFPFIFGFWIGRFCMQRISLVNNGIQFKNFFSSKNIGWGSISKVQVDEHDYHSNFKKGKDFYIPILMWIRPLYEKGAVGKYLVLHYGENGKEKVYSHYVSSYVKNDELLRQVTQYTSGKPMPNTGNALPTAKLPGISAPEISNIVVSR
jgi:hypothetical protein